MNEWIEFTKSLDFWLLLIVLIINVYVFKKAIKCSEKHQISTIRKAWLIEIAEKNRESQNEI